MSSKEDEKENKEGKMFMECSRHGRRNAFGKIICKCQIGNPDATEHTKDCEILAKEMQELGEKTGDKIAVKTSEQ